MLCHIKFFGRKAGALGKCYYHTITLHVFDAHDPQHRRLAVYAAGYENVTEISYSDSTERVLSWEEELYNKGWPIMPPHTF